MNRAQKLRYGMGHTGRYKTTRKISGAKRKKSMRQLRRRLARLFPHLYPHLVVITAHRRHH